jgi:hypothetical protein
MLVIFVGLTGGLGEVGVDLRYGEVFIEMTLSEV